MVWYWLAPVTINGAFFHNNGQSCINPTVPREYLMIEIWKKKVYPYFCSQKNM